MANAPMSLPKDKGYRYPDGSELHATLLGIPSVFERLIYVASLANGVSDGVESQQAVRAEHQAVFEDWLALNLRDKQADLEVCAADLGHSASGLMRHWIQLRQQRHLLPSSALAPQRELFMMELEVLFVVI